MITEKPAWIRHEGLQIFSIDIQPGGHRFATGGGDQKVPLFSSSFLFSPVWLVCACVFFFCFLQINLSC
jgi:hypothetical protein